MMNSNHPDDELLAAFAGADPDATGDRAVSEHLTTCAQCAAVVDDLRSLTSALAELPDLVPHRPLRFLPPASEPRPGLADRVGGVVRGIFAPALTAGAALALVGAVGTFAPSLGSLGGAGGAAPAFQEAADADASAAGITSAEASDGSARGGEAAGAAESAQPTSLYQGDNAAPSPTAEAPAEALPAPFAADSDRPIWPMLLFSGVALIVVLLLLRWIFASRPT
jgi:hypothetical protein